MNKYEHFVWLDFKLWADDPNFDLATKNILDIISKHLGKAQKRYFYVYLRNLKIALLNLFCAYKFRRSLFVAYSRNEKTYRTVERYNTTGISYSIVKIFDALEKEGFINEHKKGFFNSKRNIGKWSRIRANPILIREIYKYITDQINTYQKNEAIILKGSKIGGKAYLVEYTDTLQTRLMRLRLRIINNNIQKADILHNLDHDEITDLFNKLNKKEDHGLFLFQRQKLHRIFNNGSFDKGGRFYGHWIQLIPKEYRKKITINGSPVCELDFSGMHIRMLYSAVGQEIAIPNVYRVLGYRPPDKPILKKLLQAMINAGSEKSAIKAVLRELNMQGLKVALDKINLWKELLINKHQPIKEFFFSGIGLDLQFIDSCISEKILMNLADHGIPVLPIHDSFIVQVQYRDALEKAMKDAYHKEVGFEPKVDQKY
jgi:hypothetical protein